MGRPGGPGEPPHQQRDGDAVGAVVGEGRREEAEYQRPGLAPEPDVLMKQVHRGDRDEPADPCGRSHERLASHWNGPSFPSLGRARDGPEALEGPPGGRVTCGPETVQRGKCVYHTNCDLEQAADRLRRSGLSVLWL